MLTIYNVNCSLRLADGSTILERVDALHDIKRWLESLSKDDHLLLVHLY